MATFAWNDGSEQVVTVEPSTGTSDAAITISTPQTFIPTTRSMQLEASLDGYDRRATINVIQSPIGIDDMKIGSTFIVYRDNGVETQLMAASLDASDNTTKVSTFNKVKTWLKKLVQ